MDRLSSTLGVYWLCLLLLGVALYLSFRLYRQRQAGTFSLPLAGMAGAIGLFALGGLLPPLLVRLQITDDPTPWAWWLAAVPLAGLFIMLVVVILSGRWWARVATGLAAGALLGLAGATLAAAG